jgi:hypothetical protein
MPGGVGTSAERAVQVLPTLRVLFTSGYSESAIVPNSVSRYEASNRRAGFAIAAKSRRILDRADAGQAPLAEPKASS